MKGFWAFISLLVVLLLVAVPAWAVGGAEGAAAGATGVRAGSRSLFTLESGLGSITAEERARIVNQRIERVLHDTSLDPRAVAVRLLPDGTPLIAIGNFPLISVAPGDAAAAELTPAELAEQWAATFRSNLTQLQPLFAGKRTTVSVKTLAEHRVLLLILQVAVLLLAARLCGELALRLGQPPVIGQLLAGILLGHSVLGALWPELKALVFPVEATQSYLLEVVSWIGVLLLLLLTGLETDIALIRQQGRPVVFIAVSGVLVPFALGAGVGYLLPAALLTVPESRLVLSLFLGTVLSVSSVPVIAKILLDMRLLRRNVGQLILAAALAHDTAGWLVLGVVASLAQSGSIALEVVGKTVLGTALFLGLAATVGPMAIRRLLRWVNDRLRMEEAVLTAVVVLMLLGAAATQLIGVHAVLGAFVVGILLRESPVVSQRVLHPLEAVTTGIFAPIFFAAAGLHVNLGLLANPALLVPAAGFTAAACAGKIAGCYAGARWASVPHWEALSVGFGTNARGAMGLIVGVLGFSLGILTVDMFSVIVLMAVVTTAITPSLLHWSLRRVQPAAEEEARLRQEELRAGSFIGRLQRILLPTRGGSDATYAGILLGALSHQQALEITGLYVADDTDERRDVRPLAALRDALRAPRSSFHALAVPPGPPDEVVAAEARRGYDLLVLGSGPPDKREASVFGPVVDGIARAVRMPLLVVRAPLGAADRVAEILLPTATAAHSIQAAELAVAIARSTGARITALHVYEELDEATFWLGDYERRAEEAGSDLLEQVRSLGEAYGVPVETLLVRGDHAGREIVRVARERQVDLIVLGGSARPTRNLFVGSSISAVLRGVDCGVAVLRP